MNHDATPEQEVTRRFYGMVRALRRQGEDGHAEVGELTMLQMQALSYVQEQGRASMGELAAELHVSPAALTALVERLVSAGWLERLKDEEDRRLVCLRLPEQAAKKFGNALCKKQERLEKVFASLSPDDLDHLRRILSLMEQEVARLNEHESKS